MKVCYTGMQVDLLGNPMYHCYCVQHRMAHSGTCEECHPSPVQIRDRQLQRLVWTGAFVSFILSLTVVGTRW